MRFRTSIIALLCLAAALPAWAGAPKLINFQSEVTDNGGMPIADGTYSAHFYIYDQPAGGTLLWDEVNANVQVSGGRFNVLLGSIEALSDTVFSGIDRWLAVEFDGELMSARIQIVSVAYAHRIATVDGSSGGSISGDVLIESNGIANALEVVMNTAGARAARFENPSLVNSEPTLLSVANGTAPAVWAYHPWGGPGLRSTGDLEVTNDNLQTRLALDPYGNLGGGDLRVYQSDGSNTVEILATEASGQYGQMNFYRAGVNTLSISGGNSSQAGEILLNEQAGAPTVFIDGENSSGGGRIVVYTGAEATEAGVSAGYLQLGSNNGANVLLDNDEILARNAGQESELHLQPHGGAVMVGADGLAAPTGYIMCVNGKAIMEEIEVQLSVDWPDYVFAEGYDLPTFGELEQHIREHKHLPGMRPASEMNGARLPVGEMQTKLLEKVEELTLYMLQLKNELDAANVENAALRTRLDNLEAERN